MVLKNESSLMAPPRIRLVRRQILKWGRANFVAYPWRLEQNPWLTFVAELFLQRARARQVQPVFLEFANRYPRVELFLADGIEAANFVTRRLGLHWRAPHLLEIARTLQIWGGEPTDDYDELIKLKGVGSYTAAAWLSLHRGIRHPIIDANVVRWLSRMTEMPYNRDPRGLPWARGLAEDLTPRRAFRDFNYGVLDFTMKICTQRKPNCPFCPLKRECLFYGAYPSP